MSSHNLLLAGGGTAGHIEPALAVARTWQTRYPESDITFLGTASGLETTLVTAAGFKLELIPKVSIPRTFSLSLFRVPFDLYRSISATRRLLVSKDVAIGFGGYVAAPMYLAAWMTRTPFVIHEQNAVPGWANKVGARFTRYIALSYPVKVGALKRAELTGLPLRADVVTSVMSVGSDWKAARHHARDWLAREYGFENSDPIIFIFGGSQGSQAINSVVEGALATLMTKKINIIHAVGARNQLPATTSRYKPVHYISEMAQHYLGADLVIARSGAVTCAEINALGKYALFIPLPIGNGEQARNADSLIAAKKAEVLSQSAFTEEWLTRNLDRLLLNSAETSDVGDISGIQAVDRIVSMIERAHSRT